ncbi:tetratricopeptide repeat protein [Desulfobacula toluolica]|uniref:Sel1 repeat domain protein n=1 Tax=Desulfobacula toluolica (strain DSM 7467 / Tol2) TaxID=651182 RepID=K0NKW8_DESTT|nr:SEL1-like repeat protein [Desulfobacula toluolica]CCK80558.1 Sel1 repeat domain protein [Desulfobacula toluolica Tol2]
MKKLLMVVFVMIATFFLIPESAISGQDLELTKKLIHPSALNGLDVDQYRYGLLRLKENYNIDGWNWIEKAASQGYEKAIAAMISHYLHDGDTPDYEMAAHWIEHGAKSAKDNRTKYQYLLGNMYVKGQGVKKDFKKAVYWTKLAAEGDHVVAQYNLGLFYAKGMGVPQDYKQARDWFKKTDRSYRIGKPLNYCIIDAREIKVTHYGKAQYELGILYAQGLGVEKSEEIACSYFKSAAIDGVSKAQYTLGANYIEGKGVEKDAEKGAFWIKKAAEGGHALSQFVLGKLYFKGIGVPQDNEKFVFWIGKAAEQGYSQAQRALGELYVDGQYISKDYKKAVDWFEKAAAQNDHMAQYKLGIMYFLGQGVEIDHKASFFWAKKAADQNNVYAQYSLGGMYLKGQGVLQNYEMAYVLESLAASQGLKEAITARDKIAKILSPEQLSSAKKLLSKKSL